MADSGNALDCVRITIRLERMTNTAVWVEEPINQALAACKDLDNKVYKWAIEDPPFWKALRKDKGHYSLLCPISDSPDR